MIKPICQVCNKEIKYSQSSFNGEGNRVTFQNSQNFITGWQFNNPHKVICWDCYFKKDKVI